jgi:hypothetical protein
MKIRMAVIAAMAAAICASGCSKSNQGASSDTMARGGSDGATSTAGGTQQATGADADGIRTAIEEHVRSDRSVNMDMLVMTVDSVSVNGNQAHAQARFSPKQGGTGMAMTYLLERQGGRWVVTSGQPTDSQFAHPPTDGAHSGTPANPGEPAMPDVTDFLKSKSSDSKN